LGALRHYIPLNILGGRFYTLNFLQDEKSNQCKSIFENATN